MGLRDDPKVASSRPEIAGQGKPLAPFPRSVESIEETRHLILSLF
jgi:hypothetical protein